ncbi:hypothetical protein FJTKL_12631 [Diaporthe vaccinii]|uniref:Peptidase S8/S53 domain-containing protein n=1 Tax=Diaporthe vaccinii TaxID=105482 RepID=A0ABR4ED69_9PEZI
MRSPEWYVVPNELTLANIPEERQAPEDMFDWAGHGTDMACLAGGHTFSLAPKSNLYLIKTFNAWLEETDVPGVDDVWTLNRGTPDALHDGYFHIVQIVENRGLQGRAVISNSNGYHYDRYINDESTWQPLARGEGPEMTEEEVKKVIDELADFVEAVNEVYDDIAKAARSNGIIWIQAIGNQGAHLYEDEDPRLVQGVMAAAGDTIPRFGSTRDSEMITVSAALEDGTLWPGACPRGVHVGNVFIQDDNDPRLPEGTSLGWIDIFAPGYEMPSCSVEDGVTSFRPRQTSGAAAQVAGLVAYFLGLPENSERFAWSDARNQHLLWGVRMKQYMTALSYQWTDGIDGIIQPQYLGRLPFNLPSIVNMAYNGAHGSMNGE